MMIWIYILLKNYVLNLLENERIRGSEMIRSYEFGR